MILFFRYFTFEKSLKEKKRKEKKRKEKKRKEKKQNSLLFVEI
jgi:hypothetical protein